MKSPHIPQMGDFCFPYIMLWNLIFAVIFLPDLSAEVTVPGTPAARKGAYEQQIARSTLKTS